MPTIVKRLLILFLISVLLTLLLGSKLIAQPSQLQQAQQHYERGQYQSAIAILESYLKKGENEKLLEIYSPLGKAYAAVGRIGEAIKVWEQGILAYRHHENSSKELAQLLIEEAQGYLNLGQNQKAISLLKEAIKISKPFHALHLSALGTQGNAYLQQGELNKAISLYQASLDLSQTFGNTSLVLTALNNLTEASLKLSRKYEREAELALQEEDLTESEHLKSLASQNRLEASKYASQAIEASQNLNNLSVVRANLNAISLTKPQASSVYLQRASNILQKQSNSRAKVFLLINLAEIDKDRQVKHLENAVQSASAIEDNRALSFALGAFGEAYEKLRDYEQSLRYAAKALESAKQVFAYDSLYRWWWLSGRIYLATGKETEAIAAYRNAISSLQKIRSNIASASKEYQLDFRDEVEPIYREFMELLLKQEQPRSWQEALDVFELLQLAELESFFGDVCTPVKQALEPLQLLAQTQSLAISTIILPQKTFLVVQRPDGKIHRYPIAVKADRLIEQLQSWRNTLENKFRYEYLAQSQALYDLLIHPFEKDLAEINPKTLVFIGDRILRNVPMAALHDGKRYLIEKYSITASLGLKLVSQQRLNGEHKALIFGLARAIPPFQRNLPYAAIETKDIQSILGGSRFFNESFTWENFRKQFLTNPESASIVHLATHGRFSGTAERSFVQTFTRLISLTEIESLFNQSQQQIYLLTLSACQTMAGNDRSVFGLAGIAIRSGIPSLVGSLWFANDQSSADFMGDFYYYLKQGLNKAEALQKAQIKQIAQSYEAHPSDWSNYVLIGNWYE